MNSIEQIQAAYRRMAEEARYRPAAPSDGLGNITVPDEDLDLDKEATEYAARWTAEEDAGVFRLGCCDFSSRPSAMFAVEAARLLNTGAGGQEPARRLLGMAVADLPRPDSN